MSDTWCVASGACFNIVKTQIISIGSESYRKEVTIRTRTTYNKGKELPEDLHIAEEGEATQILGAWYGNKIQAEQIWPANIEKVDSNLERWGKSQPTIEGRRHIIQMMIGGISQYLATIQGMPKTVKK
ncbi:hypothetical protein K435DRAFT_911808, partial [Dendrothele bispora CBS 962.96]